MGLLSALGRQGVRQLRSGEMFGFRPYARFPKTDLAVEQFFPVAARPDGYEQAGRALLEARRFREAEVLLDDLVATQASISRNFLDRPAGDLPDVVNIGGVNYIWDGTHRLAARRAKGARSARVRLYEASEE